MKRWLFACVIFACAALVLAMGTAAVIGYPSRPDPAKTISLFALVIVAVLAGRFLVLMFRFVRAKEPHPLFAWGGAMRAALPDSLATIAGTAAVTVFLLSLGLLKSMIPLVVPFWADAALARTDQFLFGGVPVFPALWLTSAVYGLWQAAHLGTVLWVLHWKDGQAKDRAVISFLLTWSLGMALAFAVSSAGPLFTGAAHPANSLVRLEVDYLWRNYQSAGASIGGGISAFPSMHVALAVWVAFVIRRPWIGVPFVILVSMGAVSLGWHYSLDIVGGLAVGVVAWQLTGLRRRMGAHPASSLEGPTSTLGSPQPSAGR